MWPTRSNSFGERSGHLVGMAQAPANNATRSRDNRRVQAGPGAAPEKRPARSRPPSRLPGWRPRRNSPGKRARFLRGTRAGSGGGGCPAIIPNQLARITSRLDKSPAARIAIVAAPISTQTGCRRSLRTVRRHLPCGLAATLWPAKNRRRSVARSAAVWIHARRAIFPDISSKSLPTRAARRCAVRGPVGDLRWQSVAACRVD